MGPHIEVHGLSHPGQKRNRNEDQFLIADLNRTLIVRESTVAAPPRQHGQAKLLAVADGVGGHPHGEVASRLAIEALLGVTLDALPWGPGETESDGADGIMEHLRRALVSCEARIRAAEGDERPRMATTLTMALLTGDTLEVAHVGHGRCYLYRQGQLNRVTRDHTVAELLGEYGRSPMYVHMLYNALGGELQAVKPELHRLALEVGDVVLLCTDGLTRHVADQDIAALLRRGVGASALCEALVAAANEAGGEDNITVVVACT